MLDHIEFYKMRRLLLGDSLLESGAPGGVLGDDGCGVSATEVSGVSWTVQSVKYPPAGVPRLIGLGVFGT